MLRQAAPAHALRKAAAATGQQVHTAGATADLRWYDLIHCTGAFAIASLSEFKNSISSVGQLKNKDDEVSAKF